MALPIDDELRAEARELLTTLLASTASRVSWEQADVLLLAVNAALDNEDPEAFGDAVASLEDLAPDRATDVDTGPKTPPPAPVRDRLNDTIDKIGK